MNQLIPINAVPPMPVSDVERIANAFAKSGMFGVRDASAAMSLCLLAQAEGQHPAIAFRDYSIIQGKPAKKAEAMQRDFLQSGGKIEWVELTDTCVKATFSHPAGGTATVDWTMDRARQAGLGGKDNWKKFPRQMLRSRVISEGVRTVCPMATSGMYVPEEVAEFDAPRNITPEAPANETMGEFVDADTGEIIEAEAIREPAAREKLDGPHTSKTALREAVNAVIKKAREAASLRELDAIKEEHKHTINQARRDWPMLIDGDPRIEEDLGLKGVFEMKRAELTPREDSLAYQLLVSTLNEVDSVNELQTWLNKNGEVVGDLDGEEGRRFEAIYDEKERALKLLAQTTVGA